jgi:hypothetical protein
MSQSNLKQKKKIRLVLLQNRENLKFKGFEFWKKIIEKDCKGSFKKWKNSCKKLIHGRRTCRRSMNRSKKYKINKNKKPWH